MSSVEDAVPGFRVFTQIRRPDPEMLEQLANVGVGDLSDAMHGMGTVDSGIRQLYSPMPRIFGTALTADLTPGNGLLMRGAIAAARPGDVIVATAHGVTERATLGGAVAMHMVNRGVSGLIVDGAIRDVAEFRELGLPIMARAITPRSGTTIAGWGDVNVPIACGGAVVNPGDIVVGDEEGLVIVPRRSAAAIIRKLGNTGHAAYEPALIRTRLAELKPDSEITGLANLKKALAERGGAVIDAAYEDFA